MRILKKHLEPIDTGSDFSGVGAFDQALERLGIKQNKKFACDMDKYARQTYVLNYGKPDYFPKNVYDRKIPKDPLGIYMTSPPCQSFSNAGKRGGEDDERGVLFYNSHEFIKTNQPRFFIFENVKGLISDDKVNKTDEMGRTFRKWLDYLGGKSVNGNPIMFPHPEAVQYHIYWKVLNAKEHGIPQNRERVFIVGIRDDVDNQFSWPRPVHLKKKLKDCLEENVDEKYFLSEKILKGFYSKPKTNGFQFSPKDEKSEIANCITSSYYKMSASDNYFFAGRIVGRNPENPKARKAGQFQIQTVEMNKNPQITNTITTVEKDNILFVKNKIRRFTPRECFRFQDFPDSFNWDVSDSQAYKQAGNSIPVGLLVKIIERLKL